MKKFATLITTLFLLCSVSSSLAALESPRLTEEMLDIDGLDVTINWGSVSGATGYKFYYAPYPFSGPESVVEIDMGNQTTLSTELWEGASFYIAVKSYNVQERSPYSNVLTITIPYTVPEAPQLSITTKGLNLSLSWTSVPEATGYILSYAPSPFSGPESFITKNLGAQTSFSADLWDGAAFNVAVQAYNEHGNSNYSNIESFTIEGLIDLFPDAIGLNEGVVTGTEVVIRALIEDTIGTIFAGTWTVEKPDGEKLRIDLGGHANSFRFPTDIKGEYAVNLEGYREAYHQAIVSENFIFSVMEPTVIEGKILSDDLTLTKDKSPYSIDGHLQVPDGVTLTLEPGVSLFEGQLTIWGTLNSIGTEDERIRIYNVSLSSGYDAENSEINIEYNDIYVTNKFFLGNNGADTFENSTIKTNGELIKISGKIANQKISKNTFIDTGLITNEIKNNLYIKNNNFISSNDRDEKIDISGSACENLVIENNSFYSKFSREGSYFIDVSNCINTTFYAEENYWSSTDTSLIESLMFDHRQYYGIPTTVDYTPFLSEPSPLTPDASQYIQTYGAL